MVAGALASHSPGLPSGPAATVRLGGTYHLVHAVALGLAALAARGATRPRAQAAGWLFLAGMILFSGGLYLLALRMRISSPIWCRSGAWLLSLAGLRWRWRSEAGGHVVRGQAVKRLSLLMLLAATPAFAHAKLTASDPAATPRSKRPR